MMRAITVTLLLLLGACVDTDFSQNYVSNLYGSSAICWEMQQGPTSDSAVCTINVSRLFCETKDSQTSCWYLDHPVIVQRVVP
jgi:hypothetical protein